MCLRRPLQMPKCEAGMDTSHLRATGAQPVRVLTSLALPSGSMAPAGSRPSPSLSDEASCVAPTQLQDLVHCAEVGDGQGLEGGLLCSSTGQEDSNEFHFL